MYHHETQTPVFPGFFRALLYHRRTYCAPLVQRILQRIAVVVVRDLEIVLCREQDAVADPLSRDVQRMYVGELGFKTGSQVVERFLPGRQSSLPNPADHRRAGIPASLVAAGDDVDGSWLYHIPEWFQEFPSFGSCALAGSWNGLLLISSSATW